jgi:ubiquinone/menaquinone biosynthesis C-methylase UbiE
MLVASPKNWDAHVVHAEEIARGGGFRALRDRIVELADPEAGESVVDVGAGTGLLTLALARRGLRVWAIDISSAMCDYLRVKAASGGLESVEAVVSSAVSLPLVDECADLVVSNYCLHHLSDTDKRRALAEAHRVLRPGGRLVFGDMMFGLSLTGARDRRVVQQKVRALLAKGPAGMLRLASNSLRVLTGRWERPARAAWWCDALRDAGFIDVWVEELTHEGGIAHARRP